MIRIREILLASAIVLSFGVSAQYKTVTGIPYSMNKDAYSQEKCLFDIHHLPDTSGMPVVVWFHGGGLTAGKRSIPEELKNAGYVVAAADYRLVPQVDVGDCIDDAAAAVAWVFDNIMKYGGDTDKIFVAGHSAGAYLVSMIGLDRKWLACYGVEANSIAGLFPYSGQTITHKARRKKLGMSELQPLIDEFAPLSHIRKDAPPYIMITGDADLEMNGRYEENAYMWRMMKLAGHPDVRIFKIDGHGHGAMSHPGHYILKRQIKRILGQRRKAQSKN